MLDLHDIQGNILRGYRMDAARHVAFGIGDAAGGARFLGALIGGGDTGVPQVTTAATWNARPAYCLNVGVTFAGLQALGLPAPVLQHFPQAFQQGPATPPDKAAAMGDSGEAAPAGWMLGGPATAPVHLVVSLYTGTAHEPRRAELTDALRRLAAANGLTVIASLDANAFALGRVHFGYVDGISQPRIKGADRRMAPDMQPECEPGEFLLGKDYVNQYGGNFLGDLPHPLGDNATYGAFRILKQEVRRFEEFLVVAGKRYNMQPEAMAAKLMGRWRNGNPLVLWPNAPGPDPTPDHPPSNEFDYAPAAGHPAFYDDAHGLRCPIGAHTRRLNPRGSLVMGKPYSRRIIRRAMPYGPPFDPSLPDDGIERGLIGFFIGGDLAMQFEFLQSTWANDDLATTGIRDTRDAYLGAPPPDGGKFIIRTSDSRDPIVLDNLPRFVVTRGSAYCLIPGIGGLRFLASLAPAGA